MGAVDNPAIVSRIVVGLCTEFEPEILDDIYILVSYKSIALSYISYVQDGGRLSE